jgi:biotin operon repressor
MKASDNPKFRNRILKLAKKHATGTPAQLAIKLAVCERTVNNIIADMRAEGVDIPYCRKLKSYALD